MTGSPTSQSFAVIWPTNMPATVLTADDVVGTFNDMPSGVLNDTIGTLFDVDFFLNNGQDVTASSVSGCKWIANDDKLALSFVLNTTSDPITAADIVAAMALAGTLAVAALTAAGLLDGILPGLLILGLVAVGVLAFISPLVTALLSGINSLPGTGKFVLIVAAAIVGGIAIYAVLDKPTRNAAGGIIRNASGKISGYLS